MLAIYVTLNPQILAKQCLGCGIPSMSPAVYRSSLILYITTVIGHPPRDSIPQIKLEMHTFESDYPFCSNPRCELHVLAIPVSTDSAIGRTCLTGASLAAGYTTASFCATPAAEQKSERRCEPQPKRRHDSTHLGEFFCGRSPWEHGLRTSWSLVSVPRLPGSSPDHGAVQS